MQREEREFTIKVKMNVRWIPYFLGMLKKIELLGSIGASRFVSIYADGDGDFRPEFNWDIDIKPIEKNDIEDNKYDAG